MTLWLCTPSKSAANPHFGQPSPWPALTLASPHIGQPSHWQTPTLANPHVCQPSLWPAINLANPPCMHSPYQFSHVSTSWFGIVCSTWVWMSRGSTGRSECFILGDAMSGRPVAEANIMVPRVMLLLRLSLALGHTVLLEQPTTTLMHLHSRMQDLFGDWNMYRCRFTLGFYGAGSLKPIWVWSNRPWLADILLHQPRNWSPSDASLWRAAYRCPS